MSEKLMQARLVFDGSGTPTIPEEMGAPKASQFQGTPQEQTAELCGRVCYDSLGKGRSSEEYHVHVHTVKHYSVYEHTPITVAFAPREEDLLAFSMAFLNRPGVWVRWLNLKEVRVTANFRAILEWDRTSNNVTPDGKMLEKCIGNTLKGQANSIVPMIVSVVPEPRLESLVCVPEHGQEKWVTLFMRGSRGYSHEQVRHGDNSGISQRSTRFVDESGSPWVIHPLITAFLNDSEANVDNQDLVRSLCGSTKEFCDRTYDQLVKILQPYVKTLTPDIDDTSARKQARGAARGFLGNALLTEVMFSASVQQWLWMLHERGSRFADAEIREIYARESASVLVALFQSRYAADFKHLSTEPSPDGIGQIVVGWDD
jgi:thymidylate synthase ThyX